MRGCIVKHTRHRAIFFGTTRPRHQSNEERAKEGVNPIIFQESKI
jgi:hypothetical protein